MRLLIVFACLVVAYADTLSWNSMLKYYMYSLSTYCATTQQGLSTWTCSWCEYVPIPPVTDITIFETPGAGLEGTYGFVGRTNESILVAFRGSKTIENWILDAEFTQTNYTPVPNALVHVGFYAAYIQVSGTVTPAVKALQAKYPDLPVISTGHSLGGALSVLNAAGLVQAGVKNVEIWNFGQPRVGNAVFAKYINGIVSTIYRVVNMGDIVPHLPPQSVDYHHEATEIWFPKNHTTYVICDSTGEDLKCSDSLSPLKYSVDDHTDYLGYGENGLHPSNAC
jgi:hypothetical protein